MAELFKNLLNQEGGQTTPQTDETAGSNEGATEKAAAEESSDEDTKPDTPAVDPEAELDVLKSRAKLMGISFSNNIGIDALRKKIADKLNAQTETPASEDADEADEDETDDVTETTETKTETKPAKPVRKMTARQYLQQDALKLVRCRITNLDPKKANVPGEILTVANGFIGTVRKYVPFGEVTENGYHIPKCIYDMMRERTFVNIKVRKTSNGKTVTETENAREFAIEVLPPLTAKELSELATAQLAKGGLE